MPQRAYIYFIYFLIFFELTPQLTRTITVGPWTNHLFSLNLIIPIYKLGRKMTYLY